jgi:MFS family permease
LVLGSFFFGYITTQIPGGFLASKYGGKNLFGGGILLASILTMLTPVATRRSVSWLIALRILEGIAQVQYSSSHMQLNPSLVGEVGGEGFFSSELSIYLEF